MRNWAGVGRAGGRAEALPSGRSGSASATALWRPLYTGEAPCTAPVVQGQISSCTPRRYSPVLGLRVSAAGSVGVGTQYPPLLVARTRGGNAGLISPEFSLRKPQFLPKLMTRMRWEQQHAHSIPINCVCLICLPACLIVHGPGLGALRRARYRRRAACAYTGSTGKVGGSPVHARYYRGPSFPCTPGIQGAS